MKSVGKQLQEARLSKNWTPELAARETKIKVDRLRDLEADDYSHFSSPTYARGFVRTYARSLNLDEYKILRQLDNKLPDDDSSNIVTESGVAYLPENSIPARAASRNYTGLYVVMTLGFFVALVIVVILYKAYQVGELPRYFADTPASESTTKPTDTNALTTAEAPLQAKPVDPNDAVHVPKAEPVEATPQSADASAPKAQPVNAAELANATNTTPNPAAPVQAVKALPVDPAELANGSAPTVTDAKTPPRALPVDLSQLAATTNTVAAVPTPAAPVATPPTPALTPSISARQSNARPVSQPPPPPVAPAIVPTTNAASLAAGPTSMIPVTPAGTPQTVTTPDANKRLVLSASQDSFVRVTSLDSPDSDKPLYAGMLHSGQSVGFEGRKFSINVGVPSVVNIKLDGVNYGPHSDQDAPETFTVESHQP